MAERIGQRFSTTERNEKGLVNIENYEKGFGEKEKEHSLFFSVS